MWDFLLDVLIMLGLFACLSVSIAIGIVAGVLALIKTLGKSVSVERGED
jgi:hypothetical protein